MYIHLRDKTKPMPTLEECVDRFKKIRKPKEVNDGKAKRSSKEADRQKDSA